MHHLWLAPLELATENLNCALLYYAERTGAPYAVIENLQELEDDGEEYEGILDIWPDMPTTDDEFGWDEDEN